MDIKVDPSYHVRCVIERGDLTGNIEVLLECLPCQDILELDNDAWRCYSCTYEMSFTEYLEYIKFCVGALDERLPKKKSFFKRLFS